MKTSSRMDPSEQVLIETHPSASKDFTEHLHNFHYSMAWSNNGAIDWQTHASHFFDDTFASYTLHDNDFSEIYGSGSAERVACPSVTSISDHLQSGAHFSNPHYLPTSHALTHLFQPFFIHHLPVRADETPVTLLEAPIPCHVQEGPSSQGQIADLARKHLSTSQTKAARSRHAPYPLGSDLNSARLGPPSPTFHVCEWTNSSRPCGAVVTGNKKAIWGHLEVGHGIRPKVDTINQVCLWDGCGKAMRRESIARHILAVHMRDKVRCPVCRSHFARPDSLRRHQRRCRDKVQEENTPGACKVGEGSPSP